MRVKSIITFSIISSFFLFSLISIWKILSTLQGIELKTLNFNSYFLCGIIISLISGNYFVRSKQVLQSLNITS